MPHATAQRAAAPSILGTQWQSFNGLGLGTRSPLFVCDCHHPHPSADALRPASRRSSQFHISSTHVSILLQRAVPHVFTKLTPNRTLPRLLSGQLPALVTRTSTSTSNSRSCIRERQQVARLGAGRPLGESPFLTLRTPASRQLLDPCALALAPVRR